MRREGENTKRYIITFLILGIASTVWFLIRVIPKPSRAGYPCMRAAAPFMSSFVIYLLGISGSALLFKRSGRLFKKAKYVVAARALVGSLVLFAFSSNLFPERLFAAEHKGAVPSDFPANQPMGQALGIFPGRVVWEWDPDATNENCTNEYNLGGEPDGYFLAKNNNQAADSKNWPAGFIYDPEGDGSPMGSMGIHEHWNNENDKQYSRNLGYDYGIELIAPKSLVENTVNALEAETVPTIDGEPADECWSAAQWYHIDETWINWGEEIDSSDFYGRFKMSWSEAENLVYYLVEITDDAFIDGYVYPDDGYYNFDIVEVFIDEDASGGNHTLDENAFAYHIAVNAPNDGETESAFYACDLGANWARMNYADNLPELAMKKVGNKYYYEFSMAIYGDSYNPSNPEASRITLSGNKEMGLSMAYCDNDAPDGERDNFFGSVWVPQEKFNSHWEDATGFGRVRLISSGSAINHAVEVTGTISDYEVAELGADLVIHDNLLNVFNDPDGDDLAYTVTCDEASLNLTVSGQLLKVNASAAFEGEADVTVTASDGEFTASTSFKITSNITGIPVDGISGEISSYPNPFTDFLSLKVNLASGYTGPLTIEVYNMSGIHIRTHSQLSLVGGNGAVSLDMSGEPQGQYVLQVHAGVENHSMVINKQ